MLKRVFAACILIIIMLTMCGCVPISLTQVQSTQEVVLPEPMGSAPPAPVGDTHAERNERVTLYYISADQQQLSPLSRSVRLMGGESVLEKALERLLESTGTASILPVVPQGTILKSVEISQNIATVSLSVDALALNAQSLCWMKAAIANTLTGLEGIEYVNVLINGKEESAMTLPAGTLSFSSATLTALWAQQQADEERYISERGAAQIERRVTLYFGAQMEDKLLPETRNIVLLSENMAVDVIDALRAGPECADALPVIPADAELNAIPEIAVLEDGRRVLMISFRDELRDQLKRDSIEFSRMLSSLAYTLCRTIPQLDGITVGINAQPVTRSKRKGISIAFRDGVVMPEDFDDAIARMGTVYFSNREGNKLAPVRFAMEQQDAVSPRALLGKLIAGPEPGGNAVSVLPEGIGPADILGVRIEDGCALVNLSSNFYRLSQSLTRSEERNLIYAMVNTLCEIEEVYSVRFYVSGEEVESLSGWIYLKSELLPNPGLIAEEQPQ